MNQDKTMQRITRAQQEQPAAPLTGGGPSPLLQQAAAYTQVARDALADCERGIDAELELQRRRNRSGQ